MLQSLANEAGVELSDLNPRRVPEVRYLPKLGQGPRRTCVVESLQWSDLDLTSAPGKEAGRTIGRLWLSKIRPLVEYLERNGLLSELDLAESTDIAITLQMIEKRVSEVKLLHWLQQLRFQNGEWQKLKAQLTEVLVDRQCVVCGQIENSRADQVCAACQASISNFAGFCLIWNAIPDGESSHLTCCAELKEKACRFFKHRQFTQATLNLLARWLRDAQPAASPATVGIQELLDLLDSRTPRIPKRPPKPQVPEPPPKLLCELSRGALRLVLKFLWNLRRSVKFEELPAEAFQDRHNRNTEAVLGMLKRLKSALGEQYHLFHLVLEIDKRAETVELIHEVP